MELFTVHEELGTVGTLCLTACCLPENKQASDYDINANLNVSQ